MNVRNVKENPERKAEKGDAPEEKGERKEGAVKKFGKYFVATTAVIATLGLAGCKALDSTGRRAMDVDADTSSEGVLDGIEDMDEMDGEVTDVPEDELDAVDVPEDTEMDSEEDVVSDVEEDTSEDAESEDVESEDAVEDSSEDVMEEDVVSEDVLEEDTSMDTSVDTGVDTIPDVSVDDVLGDDAVVACEATGASAFRRLNPGTLYTIGGIEVRYDGVATSGNAEFSILCGGTVVRSGIEVGEGATHTEDVSAHSFRVELNPTRVESSFVLVNIDVDAY